ncbi:MAG TPA: sporulation integral membrane protein YtvI, partial [Clostridiales bacterium]|nr:sporulation integral membrane protein YtvI [Clostridiales bacterium]
MLELEKRRRLLINFAYFAVIGGLYYAFMRWAFWLFLPFIFSGLVAMAMQTPVKFLASKTKLKHSSASALSVGLMFFLILIVFGLVGFRLIKQMRGLFESLVGFFSDPSAYVDKIEAAVYDFLLYLPTALGSTLKDYLKDFFDNLRNNDFKFLDFSFLSGPLGGVWSTAKALPEFVIAVIISIVSCFFMTADYETITGFIKRRLGPQKLASVVTAKKSAISAVGKMVKAYAILMFITFGEMIVGLGILRLVGLYKSEYLLATAVLVAVVDIVPVLGTGTVLLPWAAFSFLTDKTGLGIGLLVMYIIIYVIRQGIEPKIVAGTLGLPPILTLVSMYIGAKLFGFIGLFALPITLIVVKILNDEGILKLWPAP